MFGWKMMMNKRSWLDYLSPKRKNWFIKTFITKKWGNSRELPVIKEKSFKQLWEERDNPKR
jgi:hypothetical protein